MVESLINIDDLPKVASWDSVIHEAKSVHLNFHDGEFFYDYLIRPTYSDVLVVFFPAALESGKRRVPYFYRWSYTKNISHNVICVSDPTLHLNDSILGGWFVGTPRSWVLKKILEQIRSYSHARNIKQIIFCGASLGGFAAIMSSLMFNAVFPRDFKVSFIAEGPQISLLKYQYQSHIVKLLKEVFVVNSYEDLTDEQLSRFDIGKIFNGIDVNGFAVFKQSDVHHYEVQMLELTNLIKPSICVIKIPADLDNTGHTPLIQATFNTLLQISVFGKNI
jgi:hypothetical protein